MRHADQTTNKEHLWLDTGTTVQKQYLTEAENENILGLFEGQQSMTKSPIA